MQDMTIHSLSEVDKIIRRAVCSVCGPTKIKVKKHGVCCWAKILEGRKRWRRSPKAKASAKRWRDKRSRNEPYRRHVKMICERCGFEAVDVCQIDGHHKDRNRKNNKPENIESVCAMCHRLIHANLEHLIKPMDTSSFDKKMEEYRKQAVVGVPFPSAARNASAKPNPEIKEAPKKANPPQDSQSEVKALKDQIKLLLEDNDRLTNEVKAIEGRLQRVARLTDSEKLILWIRKYDALKVEYDKKVGGTEFSQ